MFSAKNFLQELRNKSYKIEKFDTKKFDPDIPDHSFEQPKLSEGRQEFNKDLFLDGVAPIPYGAKSKR